MDWSGCKLQICKFVLIEFAPPECQKTFHICKWISFAISTFVLVEETPFPLLICTWILKNQVGKLKFDELQKSISKWIFTGYTGSKNSVRNRLKIWVKNCVLITLWFYYIFFTGIHYQEMSSIRKFRKL